MSCACFVNNIFHLIDVLAIKTIEMCFKWRWNMSGPVGGSGWEAIDEETQRETHIGVHMCRV